MLSISLAMYTQSDRYRCCLVPLICVTILVMLMGATLAQTSKTFDYCNARLCSGKVRHVACNGFKFGRNCSRPMLIRMIPKYSNLILDYHNSKRDQLACGSMRRFAGASAMRKLNWSDELARLAEYNAKSCTFAHDDCHNTVKYRYTGQNIAMKWFHGLNYTGIQIVRDLLRKWYLEHKLTKQRDVDRFVFSPLSYQIGHFTQMVHADTTEIGCALVRFSKNKKNVDYVHYYLVCNYSEGNIEEQPVYRKGRSCSKCKHGCNRGKYRCLCR
ncbi:antigen 5 like allergen Cul n 1-like [Toxorhynchites rutilus septentrionalis]|uniref:antigen 5 like allergen Cul n 1-like n=1 Tax=Toxorhynchites rutilus septentrionalis TaxID=329112 RepID=UPI002479E184|nr:antigen 5 like allergen Cul n 1-like [Toxorhynchites rutilus septentrionalis]